MSEVASTGRIEIGRVIQQLFGVLSRNIGPFFGLALVLSGVPQAITAILQRQTAAPFGRGVWLFLLMGLISFVASLILSATLIHATTTDLKGERVSIADSLRFGASNFVGVFAITLVMSACAAVGFILFVVPGVIVLTAWSVAVPSYLNERRTDIMGSFGRSAELTRGNRWRVLGLLVLAGLLIVALQLVVLVLTRGMSAGVVGRPPLAVGLGAAVVNIVSALISHTGVATLYVELRRAKGGFGTEGLAAVFD